MISSFNEMNSFLLLTFLTRVWGRRQRGFLCLPQRFLSLHFSTFFPELNLSFYIIFASILQYLYTKLTTFNFPCHGRIQIKLVSGYCLSVLFCLSFVTITLFPLFYLFSWLFAHGISKTIVNSPISFTPLYRHEKGQKKKRESEIGYLYKSR